MKKYNCKEIMIAGLEAYWNQYKARICFCNVLFFGGIIYILSLVSLKEIAYDPSLLYPIAGLILASSIIFINLILFGLVAEKVCYWDFLKKE